MTQDRAEYLEKMGFSKNEDDFSSQTGFPFDKEKMKIALNEAHEIRRFEIELFWKRAAFFWAFILASYTAYFFILYNEDKSQVSCKIKDCLLCATSFIGFFFSYAMLLANKGSKFWQKNWENHIYCLEHEISGDLLKTFLKSNDSGFFPFNLKEYDFSVTKITMISSIVLTFIGLFIFILQIVKTIYDNSSEFKLLFNLIKNYAFSLIILFLLAVCFITLFIFPFFIRGNKKSDNEQIQFKYHTKKVSVE